MNPKFRRFVSGLKDFLGLTPARKPSATLGRAGANQFIDIQRRLRIYLRALWDMDFILKPSESSSDDQEEIKPFIENRIIYLPSAIYDSLQDSGMHVAGLEIYRAAAAHAAAHILYTLNPFSAQSLNELQVAMISVIEDARVEALSIRKLPGLKQLWKLQHKASPLDNKTAGDYLNRLARALLDEAYRDDDSWIGQGRTLFKTADSLDDSSISHTIGITLADLFLEKEIRFDSLTDTTGVRYRDDNRYLWRRLGEPLEIFNPFRTRSAAGGEEVDKDSKKSITPTPEESANEKPLFETFFYPEWNYRSQSEDQSWVTLRERSPEVGDLQIVNNIISENHHLVSRMKALLQAIRDGMSRRIRKLEEGDEVDINAAIRAQLDLKQGMPPDVRIMMRSVRKTRDISVLMLLDLSKSMNNRIPGRDQTALQLTRQASVLLAEAIEAVGDPFAIHGFFSDSRHYVEYFRLKDFEQSYDEVPKARLAGMAGRRSTRMGAAIRHATYHLNNQKSSKKLLIIMTDGEPSDIDVPDRKYLHDDTKKSVQDARRSDINTYCISLDPGADQYVSRIFGAKNYMVVDQIKKLPEKILLLYAALTH